MSLNNTIYNRKPNPYSFVAADMTTIDRIKRLQDVAQFALRNTRAVVSHPDSNFAARFTLRRFQADLHRSPFVGIAHGIPNDVL